MFTVHVLCDVFWCDHCLINFMGAKQMNDKGMTRVVLSERQFDAFDLKLNGINGAINRLSDNTGKWLAIIAQSLSDDNPELQAKIDALTKDLKTETDKLKSAIDSI